MGAATLHSNRVGSAVEALLELGWLATLLAVPIYFNVNDVRAFEPDKAYLLRDCAAILVVLAFACLTLRLVAAARHVPESVPAPGAAVHNPQDMHGASPGSSGSRPLPAGSVRRLAPPSGFFRSSVLPSGRTAIETCVRRFAQLPTLVPMLALAGIVLLSTANSILPAESWNGSYDRAQGGLTTLAYLAIGLAILGYLRRIAQAERLGTAIALAGVAPAAYGWLQHFGADPLPWQQADLALRVPGTMGNPIFLGALLVMTIPFAAYRCLVATWPDGLAAQAPGGGAVATESIPGTVRGGQDARGPRAGQIGGSGQDARAPRGEAMQLSVAVAPNLWQVCFWAAVVLLQLGALVFTKSRGPFAGLLAASAVFVLATSWAWALVWLRRLALGAIGVAAALLLSVNLLGAGLLGPIQETSALRLLQWNPVASGSSEVRLDIWGPALSLIPQRPLLGCGPDVLMWCYYPVYPTALRHIEAPNAVPDRTHNMFLDSLVETGLLGFAALLALLGTAVLVLCRLVARAPTSSGRLLAAALLAALAGHMVEGFFGIEIVATQLLTWTICGAAGALALMTHHSTAPQCPDAAVRRQSQAAAGPYPATQPRAERFEQGRAARPRPRTSMLAHESGSSAPYLRHLRFWLAIAALLASLLVAWQVLQLGASATAADEAAAEANSLEQAAMGNSGQNAMPAGVKPQPALALQQFAAAASLRNQAIAEAPGQEEYLLDAGTTYVNWAQAVAQEGAAEVTQAAGLYAQALEDFGQGARMNPYNPDHLRNTGKVYERWAGLGHDPNQPLTWNQTYLGYAAAAFARAAQLAPHHPDPLTSWAEVAIWQGKPEQAITLANRALALDSRDGDGYRLRATAEIALGRRQAALADWRKALADPQVGQRGETAASLATAEATWAHLRCQAVADAHTALAAGSLTISDTTTMQEIVHVDAPHCPGT